MTGILALAALLFVWLWAVEIHAHRQTVRALKESNAGWEAANQTVIRTLDLVEFWRNEADQWKRRAVL